MPAPDLNDPEQLAAYRAELRHFALGTLKAGLVLAAFGLLAAALRGTYAPWLPELVPVVLIVTALGLMLIGIVRRTRYYLKRLREL